MSLHKYFGISAGDLIEEVHKAGFKSFNKVGLSFAENGEVHGLRLMPKAYDAVAEKHPKYAAALPGSPDKTGSPDKKRRADHRSEGRAAQITIRMSEELYKRLEAAMKRKGIGTMQDLIMHAILQFLEREEWIKEN